MEGAWPAARAHRPHQDHSQAYKMLVHAHCMHQRLLAALCPDAVQLHLNLLKRAALGLRHLRADVRRAHERHRAKHGVAARQPEPAQQQRPRARMKRHVLECCAQSDAGGCLWRCAPAQACCHAHSLGHGRHEHLPHSHVADPVAGHGRGHGAPCAPVQGGARAGSNQRPDAGWLRLRRRRAGRRRRAHARTSDPRRAQLRHDEARDGPSAQRKHEDVQQRARHLRPAQTSGCTAS